MNWDQAYEIYWKRLEDSEVELWREELHAQLQEYTHDEIIAAIREHDTNERGKPGGNRYPPRVGDIIARVRYARSGCLPGNPNI